MHELSIAEAAVEIVREHVPAGADLRAVCLRAGPLRGIEPEALQWAWSAATRETEFDGSELRVEIAAWNLHCAGCGRTFPAADISAPCPCGNPDTSLEGGDELQILSLEIETPAEPAAAPAGTGGGC